MKKTNEKPTEAGIDHTLSLIREGYLYIPNRRHSFHSDLFETRLLGKKVICMGGMEAAELFYDTDKFERKGAAPKRVVQMFFGKHSVQTLDGEAHQHRKDMLMSVMSRDRLQKLTEIAGIQWGKAIERWERMDKVAFYEEVQELMCRIACEWAGVPLQEDEVKRRAKELAALFESAATAGPDYWVGKIARNRVDKWTSGLITRIREGAMNIPKETILYRFAWHRDLYGNLQNVEDAAVEVNNILRPIVAISIFTNFLLLAVHHYPEERKKLQSGKGKYAEWFVQEVRRYYPFFPFLAARVKKDFTWNGYDFKEGTLTLLDIYGTNHDPELWDDPDVFRPERFDGWKGSPFGYIPQGGGDYWMGHRCAGEWATIEVMKVSLDYLAKKMNYDIPNQDLSFSMVSIPSIPHSKMIIQNVKLKK